MLTEVSSACAYGHVVSGLDDRTPLPLFPSQPVTGVSRRRAPLPTSDEVAPVVVAYLRQVGGDALAAREIEMLMPTTGTVPARSRETMILVGLAVLLFVAAFALAFALLPIALS